MSTSVTFHSAKERPLQYVKKNLSRLKVLIILRYVWYLKKTIKEFLKTFFHKMTKNVIQKINGTYELETKDANYDKCQK